MSNVYLSLLQGVIAGGTASYLQTCAKEEASKQTPDAWTYVALQANHLFLLTAETIRSMGMSLGGFGPFVQMTYTLTPLVLLFPLISNRISSTEKNFGIALTALYQMGTLAMSVAAAVSGNPAFAVGSMGMLALNMAVSSNAKWVCMQANKVCAFSALIGYGSQVFASSSPNAALAKISTLVVGFKLCVIDAINACFARQASEGQKFAPKPTPPDTDSSGCFGINTPVFSPSTVVYKEMPDVIVEEHPVICRPRPFIVEERRPIYRQRPVIVHERPMGYSRSPLRRHVPNTRRLETSPYVHREPVGTRPPASDFCRNSVWSKPATKSTPRNEPRPAPSLRGAMPSASSADLCRPSVW